MRLAKTAAALLLSAGFAQAQNLRPMPRPMPRPVTAVPVQENSGVHPMPRPVAGVTTAAELDVTAMIRPQPRPDLPAPIPVVQPAVQPVVLAPKTQKASMKGAVCQRAEIKGKALPPIRSRINGCNVPDAVLVNQVAGVALTPPATINCAEAAALSAWVTTGLQPAFKGSVTALDVADSYACRPRNNVPGNPVSVHGLGQAIDIAGFVTNSGRTYTVAQNYNAQIIAAQKAGCGTFHTILGPGSDGYHESHIHLDVAPHGGRDYCR